MNKVAKSSKKVFIGIVGGLVTLIGFILVPYPGPGWLIVFGGLAILSTEFETADRLLKFARGKYDAWTDWLKRQNLFVKTLVLALTCVVVLLTIWLLNGYGIIVNLLNLPYTQLESPLFN